MLSICTTIKNRSRLTVDGRDLLLFPRCVQSIVHSIDQGAPCELVVADWHSDDWPLETWLVDAANPIPVRLLQLDGPFSRGKGLNAAAKASIGDQLFFADVDVIICKQIIDAGVQHVRAGKAYFPIVYAYDSPLHSTGSWCDGAYGHCFIGREEFERSGHWPEYSSWGREDKEFWANVSSRQGTARERVPGFFHQWHPDDLDWKNRYGEQTAAFVQTKARVIAAQHEIAASREVFKQVNQVLPANARYLLVDEDRFRKPAEANGRVIPFLEHDGKYWGIPADDACAINDLKRLHAQGTRFIVFPWIAFWWLEHFRHLRDYLGLHATKVFEDQLVIVYDLGACGE